MARKKYLEEDSENVNKHHHLSASNANHALLHDNTNIKFGHQQQKLPLNSPVNKNAASSHKGKGKGKKHNNSAAGKANSDDSYGAVLSQLSTTGLTLREMPGDGNCLFRALADQLEGNSRNHMDHRRAVVEFMRKHRPDFEPFVEDDEPFEKYIQSLAQNGTFAGNDAIVAFARLHDVTVVIHQLNSPAWLIHPSNEASYCPSGREIHIAYHNGDHYNSVRKLGDDSEAPANIKLGLQGHSVCASKGTLSNSSGKSSPPHSTSSLKPQPSPFTPDASDFKPAPDAMYESLLYGRRDEDFWIKDASDIDRLVAEVMEQTDCCTDPSLVREALMEFHFDITSTVDYILSMSYFIMPQPDDQQPEELAAQSHGDVVPAAPAETCSPQSPQRVTSENTDGPRSPQPSSEPSIDSNQEVTSSSVPENSANATAVEESQTATSLEDGTNTKDSNQNQENVGPKNLKPRMSSSQRKYLKKQERKRESNQRKGVKPASPLASHSHTPATLIPPSNIETLNI